MSRWHEAFAVIQLVGHNGGLLCMFLDAGRIISNQTPLHAACRASPAQNEATGLLNYVLVTWLTFMLLREITVLQNRMAETVTRWWMFRVEFDHAVRAFHQAIAVA